MTRAHYTLDDLGGGLTWPALFSFIQFLPPGILTEDRETRAWLDGTMAVPMLAHILDTIRAIGSNGKAKPIPRPFDKQKDMRRFGADPITPAELESWWNREE